MILFFNDYKWTILAGFLILGGYIFFTTQGIRVCDCNPKENYNTNETRDSKSHFYHK